MKRVVVLLLAVSLVIAGNMMDAQSVAQSVVEPNRSGIDAPIIVDVYNTSLKSVLQNIATQVSLKATFGEAVEKSNRNVTLSERNIPARTALNLVLRGTGITYELVGRQLLFKQSDSHVIVQGTITGKITDAKTGRGLAGANILVSGDTRGVVSSEDGSYRLASVAGNRTVTVRLVGYSKQTRAVVVGEGATVIADFKLEASASVLDQVVVTGTIVATEIRAIPNAITVVTAKQMEERGITRIDQLFRGDIPGIFSLEMGGSNSNLLDEVLVFSRGATKISADLSAVSANTNPIKTYIDGVEVVDAQYISQIDPKSIERIEILTGPQASTIYGAGAINGVMQIFTKRGGSSKPRMTASLSEGLAQNNLSSPLTPSHQYDGSVSGAEGNLAYNVGAGWSYTGAWAPGKQMQRTSVYGGGRYQYKLLIVNLSARRGWTRNKIRGGISQIFTSFAETGRFTYSSGLTTPQKRFLNGQTLGLTLSYLPQSWWSHELTVGSDASDTEQLGSAVGFTRPSDTSFSNSQNKNLKVSQAYSSTLRMPISSLAQATLTYGADHWRTHSSVVNWSTAGQSLFNPGVTRNRPSKNSGAYMQAQFGLQDALFLTYGVRADWNPNYGEKATVRPGRYGLAYSKDFDFIAVKVRGSYGRSIRPPAPGQIQGILETSTALTTVYGSSFYSTLPSPELGPEFQQGGEGGVELYMGRRGSLIVTRYNQTVDGLINDVYGVDSTRAIQPGLIGAIGSGCSATTDLRPDGYCYLPLRQNLNVGSIRNQGWEIQGTINTGPFTTSGTYSWVKSRVIGVTPRYRALLSVSSEFTTGVPFNYLPEHTWAMNVSYSRRNTSASLNLSGLGETLRSVGFNYSDLDLVTSGNLRLRVVDAHRIGLGGIPAGYREVTAGYSTANLNVIQRISQNVEGTLGVMNLTNFYQNDFSNVSPTLGRQTRVGLRIR